MLTGIHRHRNVLLQLDVHWNVPGWYECSTQNKLYQLVCACTYAPWVCFVHGLQCLCVRGACCPSLLKQLVILSFFEVSTGTVICCYNSMFSGMYPVGMNVPLKTNRANKYAPVVVPPIRSGSNLSWGGREILQAIAVPTFSTGAKPQSLTQVGVRARVYLKEPPTLFS